MSNVIESVLTAIGAVIGIGGGIAALSYALLKFFGEKWLSAKFEERLAAYKHAQQKELEELRFKINALMDRTIKLHQKEFDVLPEAWGKLSDAYAIVTAITSPLQQYPDLDRMSDPHLEEFLVDCPLMNWQKEELRTASKKTDYYRKAIAWHKIVKGNEAVRELYIYLQKNGIFIPEPTKSNFNAVKELIADALLEHDLNVQHELFPRRDENTKRLNGQGSTLLKSLEQEVQGRLWNSQSA